MYTPQVFSEQRLDVLHEFMRANPFATLISDDGNAPVASHIPLHLRYDNEHPQGVLIGHVARANPHWKLSANRRESLAIFQGAHAYISPNWYPGKTDHHREVPTWNYMTLHAYAQLEIFEDPAQLLQMLASLTDQHEQGHATPWRVSDAPADYIRSQLRGIVGIRLPIKRLEGKWKLGQNRTVEDRLGASDGLMQSGTPREQELAQAMRGCPLAR